MEDQAACPTPPLPIRNPRHRYRFHSRSIHTTEQLSPPGPNLLPPIPDSPSTVGLVPQPLFSRSRRRRTFIAPDAIRVAVLEIPAHPYPNTQSTSPSSSSSSPSSPGSSPKSASSRPEWSPSSSPDSSPTSRPRSLSSYSATSSSFSTASAWDCWAAPVTPAMPTLRRKPSPKMATLRALRAKESDACLQRICGSGVDAYLEGRLGGNGVARRRMEERIWE